MDITYINRATGSLETEHPPGEAVLDFLYNNPFGERALLPLARQKFITEWYGKLMDSSASTGKIQPFIDSLDVDLSDVRKKVSEFTSFNDFFYRKLKPGTRTVGDGLVSPGDGKLLAFERVSAVNSFYVKGEKFTLREFLQNEALEREYDGCSMVILRLAPRDYHRYHFPYGGIPSAPEDIAGTYYSVSPLALEEHFTEVFTGNKKQLCRFATDGRGEMLIIPVGATMVGSVNPTYRPDRPVSKAAEMGYFAFGGSSVVLLFPAGSFTLDEDLLRNTERQLETAVRMGERIGM